MTAKNCSSTYHFGICVRQDFPGKMTLCKKMSCKVCMCRNAEIP